MSKFNEMLKYLRKEADLSQAELSRSIGISKSSVNMYERGEREPSLELLEVIADFFNVDMNYLLGKSNNKHSISIDEYLNKTYNILPAPDIVKKPRLGVISCGKPILAVEDAEIFDNVPASIECDFTLLCKGDSMINARIFDGDIVYIQKTDTVDNGEIAAVLIEDEATLKRVYYTPGSDRITLRACNPMYADMEYSGSALDQIRILGKAVAFTSIVR